jgi:hypothetical protein
MESLQGPLYKGGVGGWAVILGITPVKSIKRVIFKEGNILPTEECMVKNHLVSYRGFSLPLLSTKGGHFEISIGTCTPKIWGVAGGGLGLLLPRSGRIPLGSGMLFGPFSRGKNP